MSNKKITEFPSVSLLNGDDLLLINHLGTTSTTKISTLVSTITGSIGNIGTNTSTLNSGVGTILAWAKFDGYKDTTGKVSATNTDRLILAGSNVSNVTRFSTGKYQIKFTNTLLNTNYAVFGFGPTGNARNVMLTSGVFNNFNLNNALSTTGFKVEFNGGFVDLPADVTPIFVLVVGESNSLPGISTYNSGIVMGSTQTLAGTNTIDFSDIPTGVKQVNIMIDNLALTTVDSVLVQLGTSSGLITNGYKGGAYEVGTNLGQDNTSGFYLNGTAKNVAQGFYATLRYMGSNMWTLVSDGWWQGASGAYRSARGSVLLTGDLTQIRIKSRYANNFTQGIANISYQ